MPDKRNATTGIKVTRLGNPSVRDCEIIGNVVGVGVEDHGYGTFDRCHITGNMHAGITTGAGGNPVVSHCSIVDNLEIGILVLEGGSGTFSFNTVIGDATWAVHTSALFAHSDNEPNP